MLTDIRLEAQRTGPAMSTAWPLHMEIDEHGWLQENARDTPTPQTQPLVGPREDRRHSLGVGRVSTGLSYSPAYDKPEQVYGRTVTIVTVRP